MQNVPQIFQFDNHDVRTIERDGDVWFVAADVTDVLGYSNSRDAISRHCKGVAKHDTPTTSGIQEMTIIPERDLYRLIMKSKLPAAEKFENWVVSEVLPSIRKTGTYTPAASPEIQIAQAMLLAGRMIEEQKMLLDQRDKFIAVIQPKAAIADLLVTTDGLYTLTHAAKILNCQPRQFNKDLHAKGWIYRMGVKGDWAGYDTKVKAGYLEHKMHPYTHTDGTPDSKAQVLVTAKGMHRLAQIFSQPELSEAA